MKRIALSLLALMSVSAFAATEINPVAKTIVLKKGAESASEQIIRLEAEIVNFHFESRPFETTKTIYVTEPVEKEEWVKVPTHGTVIVPGIEPTNPNWSGFFNVKKSEKPAALADAIKGVGIPTAEKLIANGYFSSKPRSWTSFKAEIKRASNDSAIGYPELDNRVNGQYGRENEMALYGKPATTKIENGFTWEKRITIVYEQVPHQVPTIEYRDVKVVDSSYAQARDVKLSVSGVKLLSHESESVTLAYDTRKVNVNATSNAHFFAIVKNEQDNFGNQVVELKAERKQVAPANTIKIVKGYRSGGRVKLQVQDTLVEQDDSIGQTQLVVETYRIGWFWVRKLVGTKIVNLAKGGHVQEIDTGVSPNNDDHVVTIKLQRVGSSVFSGQLTEATGESEKI